MKYTAQKRIRAKLAILLAVALVMSSLIPSMGVMAAEPNQSITTEAKVPSLRILFSASYYAANNPDVHAAFGDNPYLLYQHYVNYGVHEGRQYLSPILDVRAYRAGNPDLEKAFGDNWEQYLWHFMNYGVYEVAAGLRSSKGVILDVTAYLRGNPDVWRMTGGNLLAAIEHYVTSGLPVGNWVNAQYTAGPEIAHDGSTNDTHNDYNDNSGGNGGTNKPTPDKPTPDKPTPPPVDPDPPVVDPDDPVQPVEHEHTLSSFDENGNCKVEGCDYMLAQFQKDCKMDHSQIDIGHFCLICGAEGTNNPAEEHTKGSLHTKNSFDENGNCARGCGLTLAEFQAACGEDHEKLHIGQQCSNCNFEGTLPYGKDECPQKDDHAYGTECGYCDYAGECLADHSKIYTTETCETCGAQGTKQCEENHATLHKGQKCQECGVTGEAEHTFVNGECTGCNVKCSKIDSHGDILQGETCDECGYEGTKIEVIVHPENYTHSLSDFVGGKCGICGMTVDDFQTACESEEHESLKAEGGTCSVCGKQIEKVEKPFVCSNKDNHASLHKDVPCDIEGCDYVGEADHRYVNGECECGAKDPDYKEEPIGKECTEADHVASKVACGEKCPNCDYEAPAHNYEGGVCARCDAKCKSWENHATLQCGHKCADCDYVDPVGHRYVNGQCTICQTHCTIDDCPDRGSHDDIACGVTCATCGTPMPNHNYVEQDGQWICGRCNSACSHSFNEGKCGWCGATCTPETCPQAGEHETMDGHKCLTCGYEKPDNPAEHVHDWENGECKGTVGDCPGCDNAGGHGDILKGNSCGICGLPGEKVVAYTPDNCPNNGSHEETEGYVCDTCGYKVETKSEEGGEGTGESGQNAGEDPTKNGETGGTAGGGNSDSENGTPATQNDALPVETVVATENATEPEPDGEDETEGGGGAPADDDEDGDDEESDAEAGGGNSESAE